MNLSIIKDTLKNLTTEEYDEFLKVIYDEQEIRFGDILRNTRYKGRLPILPAYQIELVPIEHFRPYKPCFMC